MALDLDNAEMGSVVMETTRALERAAREIVPEARDPEGKPLTLGARMYRLRDQLDDATWRHFQAWAKQRNAYTHAEIDELPDRAAFLEHYRAVHRELTALSEVEPEPAESIWVVVLGIGLGAALLVYAC